MKTLPANQPLSLEDARRLVSRYVEQYNTVRLHSAIGYVTPKDELEGREADIFAARDRKWAEARERRKARRGAARQAGPVREAALRDAGADGADRQRPERGAA
mgnify:CR=1 FL=1